MWKVKNDCTVGTYMRKCRFGGYECCDVRKEREELELKLTTYEVRAKL